MEDKETEPKKPNPDLDRQLFYDKLHKLVMSRQLSVEKANQQVEEYNHPQKHSRKEQVINKPLVFNRVWSKLKEAIPQKLTPLTGHHS